MNKDERKIELLEPPLYYDREQDGVHGNIKTDSVKEKIMECFLVRMSNAIEEKMTYCIEVEKLTPNQASHIIIQVIKNLPNLLLPLKTDQSTTP